MGLHVFEARDALACQQNENIANHDSRFVCRTSGFDFENDRAGFFLALQRIAKRFGQAYGLQADAKIAARNVALLQQRVHDAVDVQGRNDNRAEARETRRCDSDDMSLRVDDCAAYRSRLQPYVQTNVRSERRASPRAALPCNEANYAQSGDRAAGASAANNHGEIAGLQGFYAAKFYRACRGFRALQDGEVR